MNFIHLFMLFIIYSFIGFLGETIIVFLKFKKLVYRGFLLGPWCPIYGIGALIIYIVNFYIKNIFILFFTCLILFSILEYFTSFILEKIFHTRWWDYSNEKYNINGRICLTKIIQFGFSGIISVYLINPFLLSFIDKLDHRISYFIIILFVLDLIISLIIMLKIKKNKKSNNKDETEEIGKAVREEFLREK